MPKKTSTMAPSTRSRQPLMLLSSSAARADAVAKSTFWVSKSARRWSNSSLPRSATCAADDVGRVGGHVRDQRFGIISTATPPPPSRWRPDPRSAQCDHRLTAGSPRPLDVRLAARRSRASGTGGRRQITVTADSRFLVPHCRLQLTRRPPGPAQCHRLSNARYHVGADQQHRGRPPRRQHHHPHDAQHDEPTTRHREPWLERQLRNGAIPCSCGRPFDAHNRDVIGERRRAAGRVARCCRCSASTNAGPARSVCERASASKPSSPSRSLPTRNTPRRVRR